jgi:HD-GYP domain-containing protein (c-di-GMP phosphodiesterase class II)
MIEALGLPDSLKDISKIIATHHENLDGTGYPKGIRKADREEMPYITYIYPIIDRFKAMTSKRSYRPNPMSLETATSIMEDEAKAGMISGKLLERFLPLMWEFRGREYVAPPALPGQATGGRG